MFGGAICGGQESQRSSDSVREGVSSVWGVVSLHSCALGASKWNNQRGLKDLVLRKKVWVGNINVKMFT